MGSVRCLLLPSGIFKATAVVPPWTPGQPSRNGKLKSWETSSNRFQSGEGLMSIATQNRRTHVQINTVLKHVLCGLVAGKSVDILRLLQESRSSPILESEWKELDR